MTDAGKVMITPKGEYDASVTYEKYDNVSYSGVLYIALKTVTGIEPTDDGTNWMKWIDLGSVDVNSLTPTFTEAIDRVNVMSGETIPTLFGKIKKWFTDLKEVAFSGSYNDLSDTPEIPAAVSVKGDNETAYRTGEVNLTAEDIGAVATDGDTAENTVAFTSADSTTATAWTDVSALATGEKHSSILNKVSTMFKNIRFLYKMLGTTDISAIGDGTVTNALSVLNSIATADKYGRVKVTNSSAVTDSTGLALAATEKNASIEGTLANQLSVINSNLKSTDYLYNKKVIIFGDSISAGYDGGEPWTSSFVSYMEKMNGSVTNKAVGGNTIAMTTDIVNNTPNINEFDICIVEIGTNNIGGEVSDTITQAKALFDAFSSYNGDLYLITPLHRTQELGIHYQFLQQISNVLNNVFSRKYKVISGFNAGNIPLIDGLHPTTDGSKKLCEYIKKCVNSRSGNYSVIQSPYASIPLTTDNTNFTINTVHGWVVDGINSHLKISGQYTASDENELVYINIIDNSCAFDSWVSNSFVYYGNVSITNPAGIPLPGIWRYIGGIFQIVFKANEATNYNININMDIPNMIIF